MPYNSLKTFTDTFSLNNSGFKQEFDIEKILWSIISLKIDETHINCQLFRGLTWQNTSLLFLIGYIGT